MLLSDAVLPSELLVSESLFSSLAESVSDSACIPDLGGGPRGEGLRHGATCSSLASLRDCDGCVRMCSRLSRWRVHSGGGLLQLAGFVFMLR